MRNVDPNHEQELKKVTTGKIIEGQESGFLPVVPIEETILDVGEEGDEEEEISDVTEVGDRVEDDLDVS